MLERYYYDRAVLKLTPETATPRMKICVGQNSITLYPDGTIELKGWSSDEASMAFLDSVAKNYPQWLASAAKGRNAA